MDDHDFKTKQKRLATIAAVLGGVIVILLIVLIIGIMR